MAVSRSARHTRMRAGQGGSCWSGCHQQCGLGGRLCGTLHSRRVAGRSAPPQPASPGDPAAAQALQGPGEAACSLHEVLMM